MSIVQFSEYSQSSIYLCDPCGIILNDKKELEWHIGEEHNHQCPKCLVTFNKENNYVETRQQWQYHMLTEHELRKTSESGKVSQWTFRIRLPASNETTSPSLSSYYTSTMENKENDNEHDGDINKVRICNAENSALYYCMNCGLTIKNESESRNHIDRMHASWMKYKMGNHEKY